MKSCSEAAALTERFTMLQGQTLKQRAEELNETGLVVIVARWARRNSPKDLSMAAHWALPMSFILLDQGDRLKTVLICLRLRTLVRWTL